MHIISCKVLCSTADKLAKYCCIAFPQRCLKPIFQVVSGYFGVNIGSCFVSKPKRDVIGFHVASPALSYSCADLGKESHLFYQSYCT